MVKPLRVVSYNMGTIKGHVPDFKQVVNTLCKNENPDVLLLQEVPSVKTAKDISCYLGLPYTAFSTYHSNGEYGLAILARHPLSAEQVFRQHKYAIFAAEMELNGAQILLCSVHLLRIRPLQVEKDKAVVSWIEFWQTLKSEIFYDNPRSHTAQNLILWLNHHSVKKVIIGGDFNTFPFSKAVRIMNSVYDDCLWPSFDYLDNSYYKIQFPIRPRIDFIFHSSNLHCTSASVVDDSAGDHYPVRAVFDIDINR